MEKLCDEILFRIFSYLDTTNLLSCQCVCKRFSSITQDPNLYRNFKVDGGMCLSTELFRDCISKYHTKIQQLVLQDCFWIPSYKLVMILQRCKHLVELNVTGCKLSSSGLLKIMECNSGIKKLGWTLPKTNVLSESVNKGITTANALLPDMRKAFKTLSSIILHFESLSSFEQFLPVFDSEELFIDEFGLNYLKPSSSNTYGIYLKTAEKFQLHLQDAAMANSFLHFNRLIMDFVIQTVSKAAKTKSIISLLGRGNTICWGHISPVLTTYSFEQIDMSLSVLAKDQMAWLSKLTKLTHLNLSHVGQFKANLMKAIASTCTGLTSLNLSCCEDWISKDLYGLEAVAKHCTKLEELNLSCLHIHSTSKELNKLCSIISTMNSLKALSLPACSLVNNIAANKQGSTAPVSPIWRAESFRTKVSSNLLFSLDSSSLPSSVGNGTSTTAHETTNNINGQTSYPATRLSRLINDDESLVNAIGSGLDAIVIGCRRLEELEIVDTGFHSAFSRVVIDEYICPLTSQLRDNNFKEITQLVNLKKLTLAGLSSVGAFNSLPEITSSCRCLESLSISHCGLAGHSNTLSSLKVALSNCHKLKRFRLDQPYYRLREDLLETFTHCKQIQTICFICKNGRAPKQLIHYTKMFERCKRLVGFILFSGLSTSDSKNIQNGIVKTYHAVRPPLCVTVLPYNTALTEEGSKNVPYLYLHDVIHYESKVAVGRINR